MATEMKNGNPFGTHRVIEPKGALPQPAEKINNEMSVLWDNEILVDADTLNIDSASFAQIKIETGGDDAKIRETILGIVEKRGKMQNPVTGSGGMFIGQVAAVGSALKEKRGLKPGDRIASLVSLSLTPLKIREILEIRKDVDQVRIRGKAVLFESGICAKLPEDIPASLALAVLDVAGAPAGTARLVRPGDTVVIIGATGKSGMLCAHEAKKHAGVTGRVIGTGTSGKSVERLKRLRLCDDVVRLNAANALECYETISDLTGGGMADLVINCVNVPNTESGSVLMCRERGTVYFFSMATSFTKAALGAEGMGRDIDMIIGNGYAKDHAEIALNVLRENAEIMNLYESLYC